jgi:hypothetical protein
MYCAKLLSSLGLGFDIIGVIMVRPVDFIKKGWFFYLLMRKPAHFFNGRGPSGF